MAKKGTQLNTGRTHFKSGHSTWNKGLSKTLNTGRTHFVKGQVPHNYKGGISKTRAYKNFYNSKHKAMKRNASGSHSFDEWETLKAQYNWTCPCCLKSEPEIKLTQDHIVPVARGGSDNIENIQPLCANCNSRKHAKLIPKYTYGKN